METDDTKRQDRRQSKWNVANRGQRSKVKRKVTRKRFVPIRLTNDTTREHALSVSQDGLTHNSKSKNETNGKKRSQIPTLRTFARTNCILGWESQTPFHFPSRFEKNVQLPLSKKQPITKGQQNTTMEATSGFSMGSTLSNFSVGDGGLDLSLGTMNNDFRTVRFWRYEDGPVIAFF